jgi:hypothetical protein
LRLREYFHWLKKDWAKAGFILSIFLLVFLFVFVRNVDYVLFLLLLQTPLYMLHQTEEYIFPGGFGRYFNQDIFKLETAEGPLNEDFIFYLNVILIWVLLPLFGILATLDVRLGLWIPYFSFFAGIAHLVLAIKARKLYSPGLVVSLLINIPIGFLSIRYLTQLGLLNHLFINPYTLIGLGLNALLPVMGVLLLRNYRRNLSP